MAEPTFPGQALGLLETHGLVAAIEAADAMVKASDVRLVRQQRTVPALVTHVVVGETAAVRAAVEAGAAAAERVGRVAGRLVIPRPADGLWALLAGSPPAVSLPPDGGEAYDDRTVRELRKLARDRDDDRLRGRAIAQATKDELVAFLRASDR
ncbi:BMC domain-containing protein [Rubrivirga sp.]|uniref:BMC domain-containing protein n=1 Tax=Rubrivirga sp. TaxID=1885344 RepID=UPI003B51BA94